jgi:ubiquinone/menaquinone biosynthesis C-methylase UbiE
VTGEELKVCCADLYASEWVRILLGDSFHPGGTALTEHLGDLMELDQASTVLDVASGRGASALHLARRFGCAVVGVDLSRTNVEAAREAARAAGLDSRVRFEVGDAETLRCDQVFDAVLCECAFCTFPDKAAAAASMARSVRPDGRIGFSDVVRDGPLPLELDGIFAWVACIADARPASGYRAYLERAGFSIEIEEDHRRALIELVRTIQTRLLAAQAMTRLKGIPLPRSVDIDEAARMGRSAMAAVREGTLGYMLLAGRSLKTT